jgi:hypothetical protein
MKPSTLHRQLLKVWEPRRTADCRREAKDGARATGVEMVKVQRKKFYFGPKIMVPLRAMQAEAKRANAKE